MPTASIKKDQKATAFVPKPRKPGRGYRPVKTSDNPPKLPKGGSAMR